MSITVANTGNSTIDLRAAAITSTTSVQGGMKMGPQISEYFAVESNGSLAAVTLRGHGNIMNMLATSNGFLLQPGQSVTFTYSGNITLGLLQWSHSQPDQQIAQGQQYVISLMGNGMVAQTDTTAS